MNGTTAHIGRVDVLVLGGGPAGRALAGCCAALGLRTALADPDPDRAWTATYCAWPDELPGGLPASVFAARPRARAVLPGCGARENRPDDHASCDHRSYDLGPYLVLDTAGLRACLDERLAGPPGGPGVTVLTGRVDDGDVRPGPDGHRVRLRRTTRDPATGHRPDEPDGSGSGDTVLTAALVVDATGAPSRLRPAPGPRTEQTAYGVVVPAAAAAPVVGPGEAVFMDWRPPPPGPGRTHWPTFLYAVPYGDGPERGGAARESPGGDGPAGDGPGGDGPEGDGTVLLEETSLARRPGLPLPELRERLDARLTALGVTVPAGAPVERVRFPVDSPRTTGHPVAFGAATPLVHPATGFSVAPALRLAPQVAAALATHLPHDPARAAHAAERLLWSPAARAVHVLRAHGLRTVLDLPPALVPGFFDAFFRSRRGRAFLTGRDDVAGTLAGMAGVFTAAPGPVRRNMLRSALRFHPSGR
ncbi:lycopene cyclase family protein [Pseudonocardia phyllosphaerae]|uniref:lycopene cyclase family protein n=1 Tax=Pseudonocardia phyllosphaerae TaxID=3390502 RepID=UPI00397E8776